MTNNLLNYYVQYRSHQYTDWNTEAIFLLRDKAVQYLIQEKSYTNFEMRLVLINNDKVIEEIRCS